MSTPAGSRFVEAVRELLAAQWATLGLAIDGRDDDRVVDPEALILITATIADRDPRLADVSVDWCIENARYVSVGRLRALLKAASADSREALAWYAARVRDGGGPAWPMAGAAVTNQASRGRVEPIDFRRPETLLLRLRALVGVNARAEVLLALAASRKPLTVRQLASRSGCTRQNVLSVVGSLSDAGALMVVREGNRNEVALDDTNGIAWLRPDGMLPQAPSWLMIMPMLTRVVAFVEQEWRRPAPISALVDARALEREAGLIFVKAGWPQQISAARSDVERAFDSWLDQLAEAIRPRSPSLG